MKCILDLFYKYSGSRLNSAKSEFFGVGLSFNDTEAIRQNTRFKIGSLHVRYLRVPLTSKKLSCKDYEPLLRKMKEKIAGWFLNFFLLLDDFNWCNLCYAV